LIKLQEEVIGAVGRAAEISSVAFLLAKLAESEKRDKEKMALKGLSRYKKAMLLSLSTFRFPAWS
jgi:hypothetical protein